MLLLVVRGLFRHLRLPQRRKVRQKASDLQRTDAVAFMGYERRFVPNQLILLRRVQLWITAKYLNFNEVVQHDFPSPNALKPISLSEST